MPGKAALAALAGLAAAACQAAEPRDASPRPVHAQLVVMGGGDGGPDDACFRCHGIAGEGDGASPRLAGLPAGYLEKQLLDYALERRPDKVMSPISRMLSEEERRAVAVWYAARPAPGVEVERAHATTTALAERLYWRGDRTRGLAACSSCHGPPAAGRGPGFPPLAGQPAAYTREQLMRWRKARRRNDPLGVMVAQARRLTEPEIGALASYLAGEDAAPGARPPAHMP